MARKRPRDDEDDDDDLDYRPSRRETKGRGGFSLALGVGLGVGALVVVAVIVIFVARSRQTEAMRAERDAVVAAEAMREAEVARSRPLTPPQDMPPRENILRSKPAAKAPRGRPGANWQKAVGTWRREQPKDDPGQFPGEFEFRKDFTARAQHNRPKDTVIHEALVEVQYDEGESLSLTLHIENGEYNYPLKLKSDGTLILDRSPALTFVRVK